MFINIGIRKTQNTYDSLFWFRYENSITFLSFSTRGERDTISFYADFSIWPHHVRHPAANSWSGLGELRKINFFPLALNLNQLFFDFPESSAHRFRAWRHSRPRSYFLSGVLLWHLWLSQPPCARVNTCTQCVHLTNPCTKPKGSQPY